MMRWEWEENSVLYSKSPYVPPREIFQAVCNELGRYFSQNGAKYTRSNRKIKFPLGAARLETVFWSSHSNTAGEWVNLEIVSTLYAADKSGLERNGLIYYIVRPNNFNVYGIDEKLFSEIIEYINGIYKTAQNFNTREGIRRFLAKNSLSEEQFLNSHPNNRVYFEKLPEA